MTDIDPALRKATAFLARFIVVAGVLYVGWAFLSALYLSTLAAVFNNLADESVQYAVFRDNLAIVYNDVQAKPLVLALADNDIFFMNLLVVVGLLLATPIDGSTLNRVGWTLGAGMLVWMTHLLSLFAGEYLVIWDFVDSLPGDQALSLGTAVEARFPRAQEVIFRAIFDRWRLWVRPTLALLLWFFFARGYLRLDVDTAPVGSNP